ncbi:MAG: Formamidopyrimidine-DNA glycosylase [Gemmatimonadetes bacterium]|nr:Formamidopyrimidine-DNA glycosylase [Gemmatimonadota bacterium]
MPELPETETIARDLDREITNRKVVSVLVEKTDVLREVDATQFSERLIGQRIEKVWRRAKLVVIDLSSGDHIVVQPRFTGALLIDAGDLPARERQYSCLHFALDDGRLLHYRDIRRLGTVALMTHAGFAAYTATLGVEPLDSSFSPAVLSGILRASRQAVKKVLMDQRVLAGVGNIYANEALWRAGIDPSREAKRISASEAESLHAAITSVLSESIAHRGTSFRDYVDASGGKGGFVEHLAVYGREGLPCPRCGAKLIGTHEIDGRSTVLCASCQR